MVSNMEIKTIIAIILFVVSLFSIVTSVSSEIIEIESNPVDINFTLGPTNNTINETILVLKIISPLNKTYINKNIPLIFETNKPAYCSYKIDRDLPVNLGLINSFSKTISLVNGEHILNVRCTIGNESVIKQVMFRINKKSINFSNFESDKEYEKEIRNPVYGEWACINNRLQRTVTQYNLESIEYGQPCGYVIRSSETKKVTGILLSSILITLIILITILILFISIVWANYK
ncbi:MAG: hypothetical protein QXI33_02655 [Candidatus Pacearchaeota archaeon]